MTPAPIIVDHEHYSCSMYMQILFMQILAFLNTEGTYKFAFQLQFAKSLPLLCNYQEQDYMQIYELNSSPNHTYF